jgi:hypothetical protein
LIHVPLGLGGVIARIIIQSNEVFFFVARLKSQSAWVELPVCYYTMKKKAVAMSSLKVQLRTNVMVTKMA